MKRRFIFVASIAAKSFFRKVRPPKRKAGVAVAKANTPTTAAMNTLQRKILVAAVTNITVTATRR
jgi:hypothetical protein